MRLINDRFVLGGGVNYLFNFMKLLEYVFVRKENKNPLFKKNKLYSQNFFSSVSVFNTRS